ncbi:hypothetical protein E2C06_16935 [Dankookia rubra]|uniref:Uncharacterized protein n=1 Tax=Dankookia rubra TaxID=1442381 RepID=A0A4R5QG68_9PROT|nr:hypothetical protein [Dankookia rubra]TDH61467.1 hypothetical protein E2C06_16935 [Dankookia rubra]
MPIGSPGASASAFGWPGVPWPDASREASVDAPDLAAQRAIAADIQRTVLDDAPCLPTRQYVADTADRNTITEPASEFLAFWGGRPA